MRYFDFRASAGALLAALFTAFAGPSPAAPVPLSSLIAAPIEGTWQTQNGTEITIAPCDQGFCGSLSYVVVPPQFTPMCEQDKASFGAQMLDYKNPDTGQRTRPVLGMQMLKLTPTGDANQFTASIYSVEDGQTYEGTVWLVNDNATLRLGGGCLAGICAVTQDWPRVPVRTGPPDFVCKAG